MTGDESWFYQRHISKRESTKSWVYEGDEPRTHVRIQKFEPKTMFSVFIKISGLVHLTYIDKWDNIDSEKYIERIKTYDKWVERMEKCISVKGD